MLLNPISKAAEESDQLKKGVRILIADDHALFREGLKIILEEVDNFFVVGETAHSSEILPLLRECRPDLLLLDWQMSGLSGMEVLRQLNGADQDLRRVILTSAINDEQIEEALLLGVKGVLLKKSPAITLFQCITCVMADQYWIGQKPASHIAPANSDTSPAVIKGSSHRDFGLTSREMEILVKILEGKTNRELARQFSISQNTVKRHVTNIFDKLGVYNRLELALFAIHHEVIQAS